MNAKGQKKIFLNKNAKWFLILESTGRKCIVTLNWLNFSANNLILDIPVFKKVSHYSNILQKWGWTHQIHRLRDLWRVITGIQVFCKMNRYTDPGLSLWNKHQLFLTAAFQTYEDAHHDSPPSTHWQQGTPVLSTQRPCDANALNKILWNGVHWHD